MGIHWAWSFEDESPTQLQDWGWSPDGTAGINNDFSPTAAPADLWTYAGAPAARRSLQIHTNRHQIALPERAIPGLKGAVSVPLRIDPAAFVSPDTGAPIIQIAVAGWSTSVYFDTSTTLRLATGSGDFASSGPYDWSGFHYVTLKWDHSANPVTAQLWIDGTMVASGSYPRTPTPTSAIYIGGATAAGVNNPTKIGQVIVWDDPTDPSEDDKWATTFEPTADGTNTGFATTVPPGNDFDNVGGLLDTATYVEEAAPAALDEVNVTGGTIASQLGISPTTVDSVTVHALATGQVTIAHAGVGDGVAETDGSNVVLDVSTPTYAHATALTKPSGGAWVAASLPELNLEVA